MTDTAAHLDERLRRPSGIRFLTLGDQAELPDWAAHPEYLDETGNLVAGVGRSPADIEAVAFTHLHVDHVGWAWHPAPGSDRHRLPGRRTRVGPAPPREEQGMGDMLKAMEPQVRTVADGEEIFPGVHVMLTPVQITHPLWEATADHDRRQSASLRRSLVTELATQPDTIGFGVHFADVVFGRVTNDDGRPAWHSVDA